MPTLHAHIRSGSNPELANADFRFAPNSGIRQTAMFGKRHERKR
jgi:hypothetical protein